MAHPNEHHDLPFGPGGDRIGVEVDDTIETELQLEPEQLDEKPKNKVCLESHLPYDGIATQSTINAQVIPSIFQGAGGPVLLQVRSGDCSRCHVCSASDDGVGLQAQAP